MRDYTHIDQYLNSLLGDIYPQPSGYDDHAGLAKLAIDTWLSRVTGCKSVLDVGCGEGFAQPFFEHWGVVYEGIALGEDCIVAQNAWRNVKKMDFSFLEYPDDSFDLVFSRHSLEHSPMPLLTLMEWRRVSKQWLGLVVPAPEWYTYRGLNHYSVMDYEQIQVIVERAGWNVLWRQIDSRSQKIEKDDEGNIIRQSEPVPHEYWIFCEKKR